MTQKVPDKIDVRDPHKGEWVTVNPDRKAHKEVVLAWDDDGVIHLVHPDMVDKVFARAPPGRVKRCILFVAQNKERELFLWPVPTPVPDGHPAYQAMAGNWVSWEETSLH